MLTITLIAQMMFIWAIDVSAGAMNTDHILNNGFQKFEPVTIYHIGLFGVIIITGLWFVCILILLFLKKDTQTHITSVVEKTA